VVVSFIGGGNLSTCRNPLTCRKSSPDVLNKSMNAVIRMMYKQRLFVENVSHLVKNFESTSHGNITVKFLEVWNKLKKILHLG
jgi:hypothetical protein